MGFASFWVILFTNASGRTVAQQEDWAEKTNFVRKMGTLTNERRSKLKVAFCPRVAAWQCDQIGRFFHFRGK
jgi:hypothetical protein